MSPDVLFLAAHSLERRAPLIPSMAEDDSTVRIRASFLERLSFR